MWRVVWRVAGDTAVPITCVFYMAIFSNTKILQFATVELFIAFRSVSPLPFPSPSPSPSRTAPRHRRARRAARRG